MRAAGAGICWRLSMQSRAHRTRWCASEALTFSGIEAGAMDVGFFNHSDPTVTKLMRVGLRFDLPQMETLQKTPRMPGSDPDAPPILK